MPKRMLDDSLLTSPSMRRCSPRAQDAFHRFLLLADDFGCFEAEPRVLWARGWPHRADVSEGDILPWLEEYVAAGMACLWTVNERRYCYLTGWHGPHGQRRRVEYRPEGTQEERKGSKRRTPEPPADLVEAVRAGARRDHDGKPPGTNREAEFPAREVTGKAGNAEPQNGSNSVPARESEFPAAFPVISRCVPAVSRQKPAPAVPVAVAVAVAVPAAAAAAAGEAACLPAACQGPNPGTASPEPAPHAAGASSARPPSPGQDAEDGVPPRPLLVEDNAPSDAPPRWPLLEPWREALAQRMAVPADWFRVAKPDRVQAVRDQLQTEIARLGVDRAAEVAAEAATHTTPKPRWLAWFVGCLQDAREPHATAAPAPAPAGARWAVLRGRLAPDDLRAAEAEFARAVQAAETEEQVDAALEAVLGRWGDGAGVTA